MKTVLKKELRGYKLDQAEKIETPEGTTYGVRAEKGELGYSVVVSAGGELLSKEEDKPRK